MDICRASAHAVLKHLKESGPQLQQQLNERTTRLARILNDHLEREKLPIKVVHFGSAFSFIFSRELKFKELFFYHLLERGIYIWEGRVCYLSTAHTDADIDEIAQRMKDSFAAMQDGELLPGTFPDPPELCRYRVDGA